MPRGFYQGWSKGLDFAQTNRRQALEEELGRGRMMLEQAAEERAMRREKFLEQTTRERSYEDDLASYRRLSEVYPEAGAEGMVQQMHEFSRLGAERPEATVPQKAFDPETFQPITKERPLAEARSQVGQELMQRFGEAKLAAAEAARAAKMREVLARYGIKIGSPYMKDVEQMRKDASRLRQLAEYWDLGVEAETDAQGNFTKMRLIADNEQTQRAFQRGAARARTRASALEKAANVESEKRLGTGAPRLDPRQIMEALMAEGFTDDEIRAFLRAQGLVAGGAPASVTSTRRSHAVEAAPGITAPTLVE